jgi:ketosteroid isomerase-like protein
MRKAKVKERTGHMQSKPELLTEVYAAFNQRDIDRVLASMRPDVDWPNGMEGGRVHGRDEVRAYWRRQWGILDPHVEPVRIADNEAGDTVVNVHQVVRDLSGKILKDQIVQHVYSFRDGLIERMEIQKPDTETTEKSSN